LADQNLSECPAPDALNPQFDKYQLGSPRLVHWRQSDGDLLHGALLLLRITPKARVIHWLCACMGEHPRRAIFWFRFGPGLRHENSNSLATAAMRSCCLTHLKRLGTPMADWRRRSYPA